MQLQIHTGSFLGLLLSALLVSRFALSLSGPDDGRLSDVDVGGGDGGSGPRTFAGTSRVY